MFVEVFLAVIVIIGILFMINMLFSGTSDSEDGVPSPIAAGIWFFIARATYRFIGSMSQLGIIVLCLLAIYWGVDGRF
jgi:hypothetical protein